jgi:two-component system cell cycle sensor histidine kinase/response regulator CckA
LERESTILAVDDETQVVDMVASVLRMAGYRVLTATCGWDAVQVYQNCPDRIDLLVTDVIMPDLTGPVLAQRLRQKQPDLQVLFISGFHDAELVQRFVVQKGFTLLPKPFKVEALLRVVQESIGTLKK